MASQLTMFGAGPGSGPRSERKPGPREVAAKNLERVSGSIGPVVLAFCRLRVGKQFRGSELSEYVRQRTGATPDSASRILRDLRDRGELAYRLVDRRQSLYLVESVKGRKGGSK